MAVPHDTVLRLRTEGMTSVQDLADFEPDDIKQISENLRRPSGRIPDPNNPGSTIPTPPFQFSVKSQKRLTGIGHLLRYYETTGRDATTANVQWTHVGKNFVEQWKVLEDRKKEAKEPEVPVITRTLTIIRWSQTFPDYLAQIMGVRHIPLIYVIRENVDVADPPPALATNQPHSDEHGSVERELIARASHDHALFQEDNAAVFYKLAEATRSTQYAAALKPWQRTLDGRAAWLGLLSQFAGKDKWEAEIKYREGILLNKVWKGQSNFKLEHHVNTHRNAFVMMQAASEHVDKQLPNAHS